ncbi:MAG: hypothetical protein A2142_05935 [candidate division Zixibacteria bacterium RBG_16_48_11]|nr:MAG: hypothetical protein A2142_05935 [candidate division Zixibacteria bacterium RBG_16_48_11]
MRNFLLKLFLFLLTLIIFSCAKKGFPPGGPADTVSPAVTNTLPPDRSTSVSTETTIAVQFSEKMNRQQTQASIFVSPVFEFETKWKGNTLILEPKQELFLNQTYIITSGLDCQDLQGNHLRNPFTSAFSTGESIDTGSVSGVTVQEGRLQSGLAVWAYQIEDDSNESVLPWAKKSDYATLAGLNGSFRLNYLSAGRYRLLAVKDLNRNQLWDPASEPLGITYKDIFLGPGDTKVENLPLVLVNRDTTSLALLNCQMTDQSTIKLTFNKNLAKVKTHDNIVTLISESGDSLKPVSLYQVHQQSKNLYLQVSGLEAQKLYRISLSGLLSEDGMPLSSSAARCQFTATASPDKALPEIAGYHPETNSKDFSPEGSLQLFFSELMQEKVDASQFQVIDSAGNAVIGSFSWSDQLSLSFVTSKPLRSNASYTVRIYQSFAQDLTGNFLQDTLYTFSFRTLEVGQSGLITGRIQFRQEKFLGRVFLNLKGIDNLYAYEQMLASGQDFIFAEVRPGSYTLTGFVDFDENGTYSSGSVAPFTLAEPFAICPDTILVRSRWTTENVVLEF